MAAECYGKLVQLFPEQSDYKLYHAQSLYNSFMFPEAVAILSQVLFPTRTEEGTTSLVRAFWALVRAIWALGRAIGASVKAFRGKLRPSRA
jgi:Tfp pilus assembly protein PilW